MHTRYHEGVMGSFRIMAAVLLLAAGASAQDAGQIACRTWEHLVAGLTAGQRQTMQQEGAVFADSLVLAEDLAPDCLLRMQIAGYIERTVQERTQAGDAQLAARHSRLIVEAARRLWPSSALAVAKEGVHGRYNLLADPNLEVAHAGPLAAEVLANEGFVPDVVWALMARPLPQTRAALQEQLRLASETQNMHDQIHALALLHHIGERSALPQLRKLRASDQLSAFEREFLPRLVAKLEAGQQLTFADLEPLELYNER
jgi:hypothetical protein